MPTATRAISVPETWTRLPGGEHVQRAGPRPSSDNVQNLSHFQGAASSRMKERPMSDETPMGQVIQIDEARIRDHLGEMVRGTVEEALNALLDAEADRLCNAQRYERSEARQDSRAGS